MKVSIELHNQELRAVEQALNARLSCPPARFHTLENAIIYEAYLDFHHRIQRVLLLMTQRNKIKVTLKMSALETKVLLSVEEHVMDMLEVQIPLRFYRELNQKITSIL